MQTVDFDQIKHISSLFCNANGWFWPNQAFFVMQTVDFVVKYEPVWFSVSCVWFAVLGFGRPPAAER